jgi:hypothetical protein
MKSHMFAINMGSCDIVLSVEWLQTLGPITMAFKELTMQFQQAGQQYKFQGIKTGSREIVNSHQMENLLRIGHSGIITQLHSIQAIEKPYVHPSLQSTLSQHQVVLNTPYGPPLLMASMIIQFL